MPKRPRSLLLVCIVLALATGCATRSTRSRSATAVPPAVGEFQKGVDGYVGLHKQMLKKVPRLADKTSPEQIQQHESALASAIRSARPAARQGTIFTPAVRQHFVSLIKSEMTGRGSQAVKEGVKDGNPKFEGDVSKIKVEVNAAYPKEAPMSMVPPSLLTRLPKLPEQLDYRFIGRTLILRDTAANIIVDYLPEATPAL